MIVEFSIPGLPPTANASGRGKLQARIRVKNDWKQWVFYALLSTPGYRKPAAPWRRAMLTLTRRSSVEPDYDGLVSSFKVVIDSLIAAGLLENDRRANIGVPNYRWEKVPNGEGGIVVRVERVDGSFPGPLP